MRVFVDDDGRLSSKLLLNANHIDFHSEQSFKFIANDHLHIFTEWSGGLPSKLLRRSLSDSDRSENNQIPIKVNGCLSKLQRLEKRWQCIPQVVCGQIIFYVRSREEKTGEYWSLQWDNDGLEWIYLGEFAKTVQSWNIHACVDGSFWLHSNKSENGSPAMFQQIQLQVLQY